MFPATKAMRVPSGDQLNEYGAGAVVTRWVVPPSTEPTYTESPDAKAKCSPSGAIVPGAVTREPATSSRGEPPNAGTTSIPPGDPYSTPPPSPDHDPPRRHPPASRT